MPVSSVHLQKYWDLFVEEATRFVRYEAGQIVFEGSPGELSLRDVAAHLDGKARVLVERSEATRFLCWHLHPGQQPAEVLERHIPSAVLRDAEGKLILFWLLKDAVPALPAQTLLARNFAARGVFQGSADSRPNGYFELPLGRSTEVVDFQTMDTLITSGDHERAIEHLWALPRVRTAGLMTPEFLYQAEGSVRDPSAREGSVVDPAALQPQQQSRAFGLSSGDVALLEEATSGLTGFRRLRQLRFLVAVVRRFREAGEDVLPLSTRTLVRLEGCHSGNYQRRLAQAVASGVLAEEGQRTHRRPRRFRIFSHTSSRSAQDLALLISRNEVNPGRAP